MHAQHGAVSATKGVIRELLLYLLRDAAAELSVNAAEAYILARCRGAELTLEATTLQQYPIVRSRPLGNR